MVDGYNVLYADEGLKRLAAESLEDAREKLVEMIYQYVEATDYRIELVFDGSSRSGPRLREKIGEGMEVIFTTSDQSADEYIESRAFQLSPAAKGEAVVVTSDYLQQRLALGKGLMRMSSREILEEMAEQKERTRTRLKSKRFFRVSVRERVPDEVVVALKRLRERL